MGKTSFFSRKWYRYGIVYFKDIITEDLESVGFPEIKEKLHDNYRWFEYYNIISAIPSKWQDKLKTWHVDDMQQSPDGVYSILHKPLCNKIIRENKMLQEVHICILPNRIIEKWNNLVPSHNYDWSDIFNLAFKWKTRQNVYINFHFKFLYRIIATNDFFCTNYKLLRITYVHSVVKKLRH